MSYAIIRNEKYTKEQLIQLFPHNERKKQNYQNKNINKNRTKENYHFKKPSENNYLKEYKRIRQENNLKGQIHKNSIYACEMIITSDNKFFNKIGKEETRRYFLDSYRFMCEYKQLGKENIISAVVHMDEETPHMHLVFIPVVNAIDRNKNKIRKISASEFWKGKNSYTILQDKFYEYIKNKNFDLDRGKKSKEQEHIKIDALKKMTNFYATKQLEEKLKNEDTQRNIYLNVKDFSNQEAFTPKTVEEKLVEPIIQENQVLRNNNKLLKLELSKAKNVIQYYKKLENENIELKSKVRQQEIEINAMYKIIGKLSEKCDNLIKWVKAKFGINDNEIEKEIKEK